MLLEMNIETKKAMDIRLREIERIIDDAGTAFEGRFKRTTKSTVLIHTEYYKNFIKTYTHKIILIKSYVNDDKDLSISEKYYHVFRKLHNTFLNMISFIKDNHTNKVLTIDVAEITYLIKYINTIVKYITAQYKY